MSSFLVLREGDNRNRSHDGQVCPDVGQGIMAPWARRLGRRERRERIPALDGESMRAEPWLERTGKGLSPRLEWRGRIDDERRWRGRIGEMDCTGLAYELTATAGSDVVQSGRPIFDDFFQHLWPYIGNNTANVVFQMVKRLWLIRIDQ
ncbi:hypothetical protein TNCV_4750111 [Trichonephila clavipes]|nr:hypothetical protein TNCV_4750111 [Trichonephila clavipes]